MKTEEGRKFSDYCYTCLFDKNFKVLWSDSSVMFRHLSMGSKRLLRILRKNKFAEYTHIFVSADVYYKAKILRLSNGTYICRAFPEIPDSELQMENLFEYIDNVKFSSLNIHSFSKMLEHYVQSSEYVYDDFHNHCRIQQLESASIFADCYNILNAFEENTACDFIPINKYVLRTWDVLQFIARRLRHAFSFNIDVALPYVKIDYSKFELALYNLVKIILIYSSEHYAPIITIESVNSERLELSVNFPVYSNYELRNCDLEIRAIKHIFRKLNGEFKLYEDDKGFLNAKGYIITEFSADKNDVLAYKDIKYVGTPEVIAERKKPREKYKRIYANDYNTTSLKFASEELELSDITEEEMRFAEMFFSKAFLLDLNSEKNTDEFTEY